MKSTKSLFRVVVIGLLIIPSLLIGWKITQGYFSAQQFLPQKAYKVQYSFLLDSLDGKDEVFVKTFIPEDNLHQEITNVTMSGDGFTLAHEQTPHGQQLIWENKQLVDSAYQLSYSFEYRGQAINYELDASLALIQHIPASISPWLLPSEYIQSTDEQIVAKKDELTAGTLDMVTALGELFGYASSLQFLQTSALTDAVTAMEQGAASCNGKSRLFVALCRAAGIPARVVGGIILQDIEKRTSHLWTEVYVQGEWIPFDPLNGHYAHLPQNYLELYHGDDFLIRHSAGIGFDYVYEINKQQYISPEVKSAYTLWALPLQAELPISLLKLILLLPICVLIVALLKNVVGIKTFGVFLPAIIAMAMADVGFVNGAIIYCSLIAVVGLVHYPLERWGLLYTPRLVALLIAMVGTLLLITYIGVDSSYGMLGAVIFFPIIVLTIAAERFARTIVEDGYQEAVQLQFQTLLVTFFCYLVYTADFLPGYFLTFPETYILLLGLVLSLGRWIGLRITEYHRFNWVMS